MSKIIKLAVIRENSSDPCPFGLKIPQACSLVGEVITRMAPVSILGEDTEKEEIEDLIKVNEKLMLLQADGNRCFYAGKIFETKGCVECNFGSNAEGIGENQVAGAPFYSKVYNNSTYDGLYAYPLGWYGDSNISRNLYYGAFSTQGSLEMEYKKASGKDIEDALEHVKDFYNDNKKRCFKTAYKGNMLVEDILNWDDYSSWGQWKKEELKNLSEEELLTELKGFRGEDWAIRALSWLKNQFSPLVLVYTDDYGEVIGDGRGRLSLAVGLGLKSLPVIVLNEDNDGNYCY